MKKKTKKPTRTVPEMLLCISVESTCWREPKDMPPGQKHEIIEIGACLVNTSDLTIEEPKSIIIKPVCSKISPFCTEITGMTDEIVSAGISFREACETLQKDFKSKDIPWYSWGEYDKKHMQWQCDEMKIPYAFGGGHYNYEAWFGIMMGLENKTGLRDAVKMIGKEFVVKGHRGANYAYNMAVVITECFGRIRGNNAEAEEKEEANG